LFNILFDKIDENYASFRVYVNDEKFAKSVEGYLYASLTFYDDSVKYTWEGREGFKSSKVYFYDRENHKLLIGLVPRACKLLQAQYQDIHILVSNNLKKIYIPPFGKVSYDDIVKFSETLNLYNINENIKIIPYDHQIKIIERALNGRRISLLACTAAGKSLSIYILVRYLMQIENRKVLLVVPSTNLVEQMFSDFCYDYGWKEAETCCTRIYSNSKDKLKKTELLQLKKLNLNESVMLKQLTISTWQSLQNKEKSFFTYFDAVIIDEAHTTRGEELRDILSSCINATNFKIGLSGTLPDDGLDAGYIEGAIGRKEDVVHLRELIEQNIISPVEVNAVFVPYEHDLRPMICGLQYKTEYSALMNNNSRKQVMDILIKSGQINIDHNIVMLYKNIVPLEEMHLFLKERYPQFKYHIIQGDITTEDREKIRKLFEQSTGNFMLATYGCMKQGVNIKLLHDAIMAESAKSKYVIMQTLGRTVRKHKDKKCARIFDIVDDASYYTKPRTGYPQLKENYMVKHYKERQIYYAEENIPINEIRLDGLMSATIDVDSLKKKKADAINKMNTKNKINTNTYKKKFFR